MQALVAAVVALVGLDLAATVWDILTTGRRVGGLADWLEDVDERLEQLEHEAHVGYVPGVDP